MIAESIEEYYSEVKKPVSSIIEANSEYFRDLYDIKTIYVWGFSFSNVDMPYLKAIIDNNDAPAEIRWNVSYYNDSEVPQFKTQLASIGVDYNKQVTFHPLSYWQT